MLKITGFTPQVSWFGRGQRLSQVSAGAFLPPLPLQATTPRDSVRFGGAAAKPLKRPFTWEDIANDSPALRQRFLERFPKGSRIIAAAHPDGFVWVYDVVAHTPSRLVIRQPQTIKPIQINLEKEGRLRVGLLGLNLDLINGETDHLGRPHTPQSVWRQQFEEAVDQINIQNRENHRPVVQFHQLERGDTVVHPCGFTMDGRLFVMENANYRPDKTPDIDKMTGSPDDVKAMFLAMAPPSSHKRYARMEQVNPEGFWKTIFESLRFANDISPHDLQPMWDRGSYEKAGYLYNPND